MIEIFKAKQIQNQWYGIEYDITTPSPDVKRIGGNMSLHASLPVNALFKACVINADKSVNYFLDPTDWSKKLDGTASKLDGTDGNVVSRLTAPIYMRYEMEGNINRVKCSVYPLQGYTMIDVCNIATYEGKVVNGKLSSVKGVLPTTSRSETQFRADARANGTGYNQLWSEPHNIITWLFVITYATRNFQKPVDYTLTPEGYKKGGLGNGVTTAISAEWSAFNGYNPFILTGSSDSLASRDGEVSVIIPNFGGAGVNRTFTVPRFLNIENFFGHIWKWVDGVSFNNLSDKREVWIFDDPALIVDNTSVGARLAGYFTLTDGYGKQMLFGSKGDTLASIVGGSTTTYMCDYNYTPALGSGWRALFCGGAANGGANAGPFSANAANAASYAASNVGARLFAR